jgi:hypothetical protein
MDINIAEQVLDELFPSLEAVEAQSAAILQFLKDKGMATDQQLAPYLEQAGKASNVRWRAARLRVMRVWSSAMKSAEESSANKNGKENASQEQTQRAEATKARKDSEQVEVRKEDGENAPPERASEPGDKGKKSTQNKPQKSDADGKPTASPKEMEGAETNQANKDTEKVDPQKEVGASVKTERATDAINVPQIKSEDRGAA